MKFRDGFVSNSSSSSFTCSFCKKVFHCMDSDSPHDVGMFQCLRNHNVCKKHYSKEDKEKIKQEMKNQDVHACRVDTKYCPVCNKTDYEISDMNMIDFMNKYYPEELNNIRDLYNGIIRNKYKILFDLHNDLYPLDPDGFDLETYDLNIW